MEGSHYTPFTSNEALSQRRTSWPSIRATSSELPSTTSPASTAVIFEKLEKDQYHSPLTQSTGATPPPISTPHEAPVMPIEASKGGAIQRLQVNPLTASTASDGSSSSLGINHMIAQQSAPVPIRKPPPPRHLTEIPLNRSQLTSSDFAIISEAASSSPFIAESGLSPVLPPPPTIIESAELEDETPSVGSPSSASDPFPMDEVSAEPWSDSESAKAPLDHPAPAEQTSTLEKIKGELDHARVKVTGLAHEIFAQVKEAFTVEPTTTQPPPTSTTPTQATPGKADNAVKTDTASDDLSFEEIEIHGGAPSTDALTEEKKARKLSFDDSHTVGAGIKAGVAGVGEEIKVAAQKVKETAIGAKEKLPDEETMRDVVATGVVGVLDVAAETALAGQIVVKDFKEATQSLDSHTLRHNFTTGVAGVGDEIKRAASTVKDDVIGAKDEAKEIKHNMDDSWTSYTWR